MDSSEQCFKDHPKVERENVVKFQHRVWKDLYNCGKEVPKGNVSSSSAIYLVNIKWASAQNTCMACTFLYMLICACTTGC